MNKPRLPEPLRRFVERQTTTLHFVAESLRVEKDAFAFLEDPLDNLLRVAAILQLPREDAPQVFAEVVAVEFRPGVERERIPRLKRRWDVKLGPACDDEAQPRR